jgi:hypothetical protein
MEVKMMATKLRRGQALSLRIGGCRLLRTRDWSAAHFSRSCQPRLSACLSSSAQSSSILVRVTKKGELKLISFLI